MRASIRGQVASLQMVTPTVRLIRLVSADGTRLPAFGGGAHVEFILPTRAGNVHRSYSLTGDPADRSAYSIAVRLAPASQGASSYWHGEVKVGDEVDMSFPRNYFPLTLNARHYVFYAGGIGITPIIPMLFDLNRQKKSFEVHFVNKNRHDAPFVSLVRRLAADRATFYYSQEFGTRPTVQKLVDHPWGSDVYVCGPWTMVEEYKEQCLNVGYPEESVHFELFSTPSVQDGVPFEVHIPSCKKNVSVRADQTMLDALWSVGLQVPYSCRAGGCGTCLIRVTRGEVNHRDSFLTEDEKRSNRMMLPCVSRAAGNIIEVDI